MEQPDDSEFQEWLRKLRELIPAEKRLSYAEYIAQVTQAEEAFFQAHAPEEEVEKIVEKATQENSSRPRHRSRKRPQV